jgi:predicted HTH transcriptional regulator
VIASVRITAVFESMIGVRMEITSFDDCERIVAAKQRLTEITYSNLELKSAWKQDDGKKISGLANRVDNATYFLIVGIDDKGSYLNKDEAWAKDTEANVSNHFNQYLDPSFTCSKVACVRCIDSTYAVVIQVDSPGVLVLWNRKPYKMTGTTALEMSPVESMELTVRFNNRRDFSSLEKASELDMGLVRDFIDRIRHLSTTPAFRIFNELSDAAALKSLKIHGRNCANILFGTVSCRLVVYKADDSVYSQDILVGLYRLLNGELYDRITDLLRRVYGIEASDLYPESAFKESVANAVAHAAYFENNGDLIVEVYQSKISIGNLCLEESGYFANKWFSKSHNTVNNLLMEVLRIAKHVDELGRGKYLIYSDSVKSGKLPPEVVLESAGRFRRWKLILHGSIIDEKNKKAFEAIKARYGDTEKSQIAFSLVLWRQKTIEEISQYIDGESKGKFADIIRDYRGPIYYSKELRRFILNRWIKLIVEEGKASKTLTAAEEKRLFDLAYSLGVEYDEGYITSKRLRELGGFGNSKSANTQCSVLLRKWKSEGKITSEDKRGVYRFVRNEAEIESLSQATHDILAALTVEVVDES